MLGVGSRLRVTHGLGKDETQASLKAFQVLQQRGHPEVWPPLISDGWGGIDDAMMAVYGLVPEYSGRGRPPVHPRPGEDWLYLQMVKQPDEHGRLPGIRLKAVWGNQEELMDLLGKSTAYIERSNLTTRLFSACLTRKTLAFSKDVELHEAAVTWEDAYYNWVRPHKSLRSETQDDPQRKWTPRTPGMAANLTDHIWSVKELLFTVPLPSAKNTC
ncbi:MAG: IS1 family transposase [Anaerolineae bacterium]